MVGVPSVGRTAAGVIEEGAQWARTWLQDGDARLDELKALKAAHKQNVKSYKEASDALNELSAREKKVREDKAEAELALAAARQAELANRANFDARQKEVDGGMDTLRRERAAFAAERTAANKAIAEAEKAMKAREDAVGEREKANATKEAELGRQAASLAQEQAKISGIAADLRAALGRLG